MFGKKSNESQDRTAAAPADNSSSPSETQPSDAKDYSVAAEQSQGTKVAAKDQEPSVISQAVRMEGSIVSSGPLHLHCDLTGHITAPFVLIGSMGKAKGTLHVDEINVEGSLEGDVNCKLLKAGRNAFLHGDISCENLQVALGATVSGSLVVGPSSKS
jgi:cytoskeletal protein CcmA (bactofilin family)